MVEEWVQILHTVAPEWNLVVCLDTWLSFTYPQRDRGTYSMVSYFDRVFLSILIVFLICSGDKEMIALEK